MTREEMSEALLRDVHGLDFSPPPIPNQGNQTMNEFDALSGPAEDGGYGADDPVKSAGLSTISIGLTVANAAAISLDLFRITDLSAAALPTNVASPVIATYRTYIAYLQANPSELASMVIASSEANTTGAPVMASLIITPTRSTPFGLTESNQVLAQSYQTTQDFQANRVTVPLSYILDGFSYLNLVSGTNNSGATVTMNVTLFVRRRAEGRQRVRGPAMAVRPGGRGPVNAGR